MLTPFLYAIVGVVAAVKGERNMRIHLVAAVAAVSLGAWLGLSACEWAAVVVCCALVMSLECLNTAVEAAVDLASPEIHPLAKKAKDCAAGAVLIAAIGSAAVGCIIFAPKVVRFFASHRDNECCQCENVASTNTNFQFAYAKATADKLETGNIGIVNTYTMATLVKTPTRRVRCAD